MSRAPGIRNATRKKRTMEDALELVESSVIPTIDETTIIRKPISKATENKHKSIMQRWLDFCSVAEKRNGNPEWEALNLESTLKEVPSKETLCKFVVALVKQTNGLIDSDGRPAQKTIRHLMTDFFGAWAQHSDVELPKSLKETLLNYIENDLTKAGMMTTQKWERVETNFADIVVLVAKVAEMSWAPKARHLVKLFMELSADCACRAGELVYSSEYRNSTDVNDTFLWRDVEFFILPLSMRENGSALRMRVTFRNLKGLRTDEGSKKPVVIHEEPIGGFGVSSVVSLISLGIHQDVFAHPVTLERIYDPAFAPASEVLLTIKEELLSRPVFELNGKGMKHDGIQKRLTETTSTYAVRRDDNAPTSLTKEEIAEVYQDEELRELVADYEAEKEALRKENNLPISAIRKAKKTDNLDLLNAKIITLNRRLQDNKLKEKRKLFFLNNETESRHWEASGEVAPADTPAASESTEAQELAEVEAPRAPIVLDLTAPFNPSILYQEFTFDPSVEQWKVRMFIINGLIGLLSSRPENVLYHGYGPDEIVLVDRKCPFCPKVFETKSTKANVIKHVHSCHGASLQETASGTSRESKNVEEMGRHVYKHVNENKATVCKVGQCRESFASSQLLLEHIAVVHRMPSAPSAKEFFYVKYCYLCSEWFTTLQEWYHHCRSHLDETLAKAVYALQSEHCLVTQPGFCPFCLNDEKESICTRMRQFGDVGEHVDHVNTHIRKVSKADESVPCPSCKTGSMTAGELAQHLIEEHDLRLAGVTKRKLAPNEINSWDPSRSGAARNKR
ncbi:hypothetical protein HDV05_006351, partial [Chytridiales sp. JEL 0842]